MVTTQLIRTETLQLAEMRVNDLIETPLEARFNRLVRVARRAMGTRVAAISFLSREREWFKAVTGWNVSELPPVRSLAMAVLQDSTIVAVADTLRDERTNRHPLVFGSPRFRFCAFQPIVDHFGHVIGALGAYDIEPREATAELLDTLSDLGELAQRELLLSDLGSLQKTLLAKLDASRRQALLDDLTRLWNRRGGMLLLEQAMESIRRAGKRVGVCVVDVDDFKLINDRFGHAMGDVVLRKLAGAIVDAIRPGDIACRLGGDEFLLLIPEVDAEELSAVMQRVRDRVRSLVISTRAGSVRVTVSVGGTLADLGSANGPDEIVHLADEAMYTAKRLKHESERVPLGL
jgi:diguanylate cyclase (GGDEF)-like protein